MRKEVKKMKLSQKLTNALFSLNNKTCLLLTYQKDVEMSKLYQPRSNFENEIRRAKSKKQIKESPLFRWAWKKWRKILLTDEQFHNTLCFIGKELGLQ